MIFLVGAKSGTRTLGTLTAQCADCDEPTWHMLYRKVERLTVFFVPTKLPVHWSHFTVCIRCSRALKVTAAEADRLVAYLERSAELP